MSRQSLIAIQQARVAASRGDYSRARRILRDAARDDPNNEEILLLFAKLAQKREHAIQCYERVLEINPYNETAIRALDRAYAQQVRRDRRRPGHRRQRQLDPPPSPSIVGSIVSISTTTGFSARRGGLWCCLRGLRRGRGRCTTQCQQCGFFLREYPLASIAHLATVLAQYLIRVSQQIGSVSKHGSNTAHLICKVALGIHTG